MRAALAESSGPLRYVLVWRNSVGLERVLETLYLHISLSSIAIKGRPMGQVILAPGIDEGFGIRLGPSMRIANRRKLKDGIPGSG